MSLPERAANLVRQRLHNIRQHIALASLNMNFRRHARLQGSGVFETGLLVVKRGARDKVGNLPLGVLDEVGSRSSLNTGPAGAILDLDV